MEQSNLFRESVPKAPNASCRDWHGPEACEHELDRTEPPVRVRAVRRDHDIARAEREVGLLLREEAMHLG